jgi:hypothetical protein
LRDLSPEIEIVGVGLAENWRCGLCVVMRQEFLPAATWLNQSSRNSQVKMQP